MGVEEAPHIFILRIEAERKKLSVDMEATYHAFVHRLPYATRVTLENLRSTKSLVSAASFGWNDIVRHAKSEQVGGSLLKPGERAPEPQVAPTSVPVSAPTQAPAQVQAPVKPASDAT